MDLSLETVIGGGITRRYVHGPGTDEPLVWYEGAGTGDRRFLHADERGSIVAVSDNAGTVTAVNKYDEYGKPQGTLAGRFGYTGQAWVPEVGVYNYKARMYHPGLGRFLQTDPIGYEAGMNLHADVRGDPINKRDPSGLDEDDEIVVKGSYRCNPDQHHQRFVGCVDDPSVPSQGVAGQLGGDLGVRHSGNPCSAPLTGRANRGQTVSSRRQQVKREMQQAFADASSRGISMGGAYASIFALNASRLKPTPVLGLLAVLRIRTEIFCMGQ